MKQIIIKNVLVTFWTLTWPTQPVLLICSNFYKKKRRMVQLLQYHLLTWACGWYRRHGNQRSESYLFFFPAASIRVVDLHNQVILFPREPLHSDAFVCEPGHWAQNVITEREETESDNVFTWDRSGRMLRMPWFVFGAMIGRDSAVQTQKLQEQEETPVCGWTGLQHRSQTVSP